MLRRIIGEDIALDWKPGQGLWPVKMDPAQIDQMLANLCVNARDAIAGVGKITVETRNTVLDEEYCAQQAGFTPGEYVMLIVNDDGCGMDSRTLLLLFEPFFTTKEMGKGTGLGLATVYGAVKQNNGFINVYSELGRGTTFKYLPAAARGPNGAPAETGAGSDGAVWPRNHIAGGRRTGDLENDHDHARASGLHRAGGELPGRGHPPGREQAGRIDLIMTDVIMPEMNGCDLAKNISILLPGPQTPVHVRLHSRHPSKVVVYETSERFVNENNRVTPPKGSYNSVLGSSKGRGGDI